MRTALRRARTGTFLLVVLVAGWVFLRRRSPVRWIEPAEPSRPPSPSLESGVPGELPADVLATDAGLTELPADDGSEAPSADGGSEPAPAGTVVVDEVLVAELLSVPAEPGPDVPGTDEPTETELVAPELGIDEPTMTIARDAIASEDEESSTRIPMPTFSEAPTMEIPAVTDDLRAVRGIGPSMERLLHGLGIISFRQLAMLDGGELERVRAELSDFRTRIEREDWVGQARDLHQEKYGRDPGGAG